MVHRADESIDDPNQRLLIPFCVDLLNQKKQQFVDVMLGRNPPLNLPAGQSHGNSNGRNR